MQRVSRHMCCVLAVVTGACSGVEPVATAPKEMVPNDIRRLYPQIDSYRRGVYYFAGWSTYPEGMFNTTEVPHYNSTQWNNVSAFTPERGPLYGFHDEDQQWIVDQQIDDMRYAGFDYVVYQIGWSHDRWINQTPPAMYFDYAAQLHMSSTNHAMLSFAVSWHNIGTQRPDFYDSRPNVNAYRADFAAMMDSVVTRFFGSSDYFRPDGSRPAFFFWGPQDFKVIHQHYLAIGDPNASLATPAAMIALARSVAASRGYSGQTRPYFVGTAVDDDTDQDLASWDFDAISGYTYYPGKNQTMGRNPYSDIMATYKGDGLVGSWGKWLYVLENSTLPYIVPTLVGGDGRPDGLWDYGEPTDVELKQHFEDAKAFASAYYDRTSNNLIVCCWNEWSEGPFLQPSLRLGYSLTNAHRETVGYQLRTRW